MDFKCSIQWVRQFCRPMWLEIFICTSPMTNDVGLLFMCLFVAHIFSLMKYPFILFAYFWFGLLVVEFGSPLHILETSSLYDLCFANIFFHFAPRLFILLTGPLTEQKCCWVLKSIFPFRDLSFMSSLRTLCLTLDLEDFILYCL